jgi:uncharacterized repeat protein (TIGR03803 family)
MKCSENSRTRLGRAGLVLATLALISLMAAPAPAQNYQVLHYFQSGQDGAGPISGVVFDPHGNLYGVTYDIFGVVYELKHINSAWLSVPLFELGFQKGSFPQGGIIRGPDGSWFGTTSKGGSQNCSCGVVFNLKPPMNATSFVLQGWNEDILYEFTGGADGNTPGYGNLVFDQAGNLYGTTEQGGVYGQGAVYKLTRSNGGWTESVIYSFSGFADGGAPYGGLVFDKAGNLYGTTTSGGAYQSGTVYELTPSGQTWNETVLHSFYGPTDGSFPSDTLMFDAAGNLYGTAYSGGIDMYSGSVFELSVSNGVWNFAVLHLLDFSKGEGAAPLAGVTMDAAGNLYGTTLGGGYYDDGTVFKLTYTNGYWVYSTVYSFGNEGNSPFGGVTLDGQGNLYGTAFAGGQGACNGGCGVAWEISSQ